jgi:aryl-alcohol dehydrogenase-like predicted oxidoreductase
MVHENSAPLAGLSDVRSLGPYSVSPVGFGAMRLAGPNVFGPPADRGEAIALLRDAVDSGVDHIDTAEYYGPTVVNELIREALYPYPPDLVLVSKVGAARGARGEIFASDDPGQLRSGIEDNLKTLGIERVPVVNLRLMWSSPPDGLFDEQLGAMIAARDEGLLGAVGLSNVPLPTCSAAWSSSTWPASRTPITLPTARQSRCSRNVHAETSLSCRSLRSDLVRHLCCTTPHWRASQSAWGAPRPRPAWPGSLPPLPTSC